MVDPSLIATAAMGVALLVGVFLVVSKTRYEHPAVSPHATGTRSAATFARLDRWSTRPSAWFVTFLLLTFGLLGTSVLVAVDDPTNPLLFVAAAVTALGFLGGTYSTSRSAGLSTAGSTLVTSMVIGLVMTISIAVYLVF